MHDHGSIQLWLAIGVTLASCAAEPDLRDDVVGIYRLDPAATIAAWRGASADIEPMAPWIWKLRAELVIAADRSCVLTMALDAPQEIVPIDEDNPAVGTWSVSGSAVRLDFENPAKSGLATLDGTRLRLESGVGASDLVLVFEWTAAADPEIDYAAAATYERYYVPALFAPWARELVAAAGIEQGDDVLDVACGTGIVARIAAVAAGPDGSVTGLDIDPAMLAVARRIASELRWDEGDATSLPYDDEAFDIVTCGFGLMFFPDRVEAIREMLRVTRPGGRVLVSVWGPLESAPGYARLVRLLERHLGAEAADAVRTPFALGDVSDLETLIARAGARDASIRSIDGVARFPSIESWVETEVSGWIGLTRDTDEAQLEALVAAAERELGALADESGAVQIPMRAHFVAISVRE